MTYTPTVHRVTEPTKAVIRAFQNTVEPLHGYQLRQLTGLKGGTLYPLLRRLTAAGWLAREDEVNYAAWLGRPQRVYYHLTALGHHMGLEHCPPPPIDTVLDDDEMDPVTRYVLRA